MKKLLILCVILATSIFGEELVSGKLENGLKYYLVKEDMPKDYLIMRLRVNVGSLAEEEKERGVAHFLEHMAFNGTKKYEGNDLLTVFEERGIGFGHGLNAHTNFTETLYKLQGNKKDYEIFMDVLSQWAFYMTISEKEVEQEKGVVIEEWRQRTNLNSQIGDFYRETLYDNTRYNERLAIGTVESIRNFDSEIVKGFYEKWYSPNNMELYIVGDFDDVNKVEEDIQKYFGMKKSKDIKYDNNWEKVEVKKDVLVDTFINGQLQNKSLSYINTYEKLEYDKVKEFLLTSMFNKGFNRRFSQKLYNNEILVEGININSESLNDDYKILEVNFTLDKEESSKSIKDSMANLKQLQNGFSQEEFEKSRLEVIASIQTSLNNLDNSNSTEIMEKLLNYDFSKDYITYEDFYSRALAGVEEITLEELNNFVGKVLLGENQKYLYLSYEDINIDKLKEVINEGLNTDLGQFNLIVTDGDVISNEIEGGKIINEEIDENYAYAKLTLSNGSNVYLYPTDYLKDQIKFGALSRGGKNYLDEKEEKIVEYFSSIYQSGPGSIKDYNSYIGDKNFGITFGMDKYTESIEGTSDNNNLEEMLRNVYGFIMEGKIDDNIFEITKNHAINQRKIENNLEEKIFWDEYKKIVTNNSKREGKLDIEEIENLEKEEVLEVFRDRYQGDFDFYFIGDFDYSYVKMLSEKYLASLPQKDKEDIVKGETYEKSGKDYLEHNLGTGEESTIIVRLGKEGVLPPNYSYYQVITNIILERELLKVLREELGGVYSLSVSTEVDKYYPNGGNIVVSFTSSPDRKEEMVEATKKVIDNVAKGNITNETLEYIKNIYLQQFEYEILTGDFHKNLFERLVYGEELKLLPGQFNFLVNREDITSFINSIYGDYEGVFILNPKK